MRQLLRQMVRALPPVRRLITQRDHLATENAALLQQSGEQSTKEADQLRAELALLASNPRQFFVERYLSEPHSLTRELQFEEQQARLAYIKHHHYSRLGEIVFGGAGDVATGMEDADLVDRIISAYGRSLDDNYYGPMWAQLHASTAPIHEALVKRDHTAVAQFLRHPDTNHLFYGFEGIHASSHLSRFRGWEERSADRCKDLLVRFAEALGVLHIENPESPYWGNNVTSETERVVDYIERLLGVTLPVRPPHTGFTGLAVRDGVITERVLHGAYGAHRTRELLDAKSRSVVEIGAGLGYLAYFAYQMGFRDYTIIDLPMTSVAQAYFLGRLLGPDSVLLEGETADTHEFATKIKILPPSRFRDTTRRFDLVVNVDSMTELGHEAASEYAGQIFCRSDLLLSINHEHNDYTVNELFDRGSFSIDRWPFWLRNGYVEEIVRPKRSDDQRSSAKSGE
jgi:hypothetical protein